MATDSAQDSALQPSTFDPGSKDLNPRPWRATITCVKCRLDKKKCDGVFPCSNCLKRGIDCIQNVKKKQPPAPTRSKSKPKKSGTSLRMGTAPTSNVPPVTEMVRVDSMIDEIQLDLYLETFEKNLGFVLPFAKDLTQSRLKRKKLYSSPALSVRTDAILSYVYRAMGWVAQSEVCMQRAKSSAHLLLADPSEESFSALAVVALTATLTGGRDVKFVKRAIADFVRKKTPELEMDMGKPTAYFGNALKQVCFSFDSYGPLYILGPTMFATQSRVPFRASHIRRELGRKLSPEEIENFEPWDYSLTWKESEIEMMDKNAALNRLQQLDQIETMLETASPEIQAFPSELKMANECIQITGNALRCVLLHHLGDLENSRCRGAKSLASFGSVSSMMLFNAYFQDFVHIIDVAISLRDVALFDQGIGIMRKLSPVFYIAEIISSVLSDFRPSLLTAALGVMFVSETELETGTQETVLKSLSWAAVEEESAQANPDEKCGDKEGLGLRDLDILPTVEELDALFNAS